MEHLQKALVLKLEINGPDHSSIGDVLVKQSKYEQAKEYYQRRWRWRERTTHSLRKWIILELETPSIMKASTWYEQAKGYYQESLTIRTRVFGEGHPYVDQVLQKMSELQEEAS